MEFLIAVAITAMTSLAVAVVTTSISRSMSSLNDTRGALQRALVAHSRLRAHLIPALCALEFDETQGVSIWQVDDAANSKVNLSELLVLWLEPEGDGDLTAEWVTFPEEWSDETRMAADVVLTSVDDPFQMMLAQRALGYTTQSVVADGISGLDASGNDLDLQSSQRLHIRLSVGVGGQSEEVLMAFGLVNHRTPE